VRAASGEDRADALTVAGAEPLHADGAAPRWAVTVAHTDGRRWHVTVEQGAAVPPRPESCGAAILGAPARMDVTAVRELTVARSAPAR
jgi:hypothetical protein